MTAAAFKTDDRHLKQTTVLTSAGTTTFSYDFESRATSVTGPGISQTNVYNGLNARTGSTTNSVAQIYLRDGAYVTDPVLKDSSATYTPGVSQRRGTATTFLHSGLKNADTQTGTAQTVSATRRYDAFGNVVTSTGIWNGPFGYAGGFGYQEDATGLKLLGHRIYDSSTGRFLTRDPQKEGRNWFTYCWNDPVGMVDTDGQNPSGLGGIGAAINEAIKRGNEKPGKQEKDPVKGAPPHEFKIEDPSSGGTFIRGGANGGFEKVTWPFISPPMLPGFEIGGGAAQKGDKPPVYDGEVTHHGSGLGYGTRGRIVYKTILGSVAVWVEHSDGRAQGGFHGRSGNRGFGVSIVETKAGTAVGIGGQIRF